MMQNAEGRRANVGRGDEFGRGDHTILLVEDEVFVREVTCEVLRASGYEVLSARNAVEAERLYDEHGAEIALVVTDIVLAGETGIVLAAALRRRKRDL